MQEEIVSGKKFRRLIDAATDKWQRISFWSKASDCEMNNGKNLEDEIQDIRNLIQNNKTANEALKQQALVYNKDTDYYQGYVNGQWKDMVYAGLNWDGYLVKDGVVTYDNVTGGFIGTASYNNYSNSEFNIPSTVICYPLSYNFFNETTGLWVNYTYTKSTGSIGSLFTGNLIDFTNYNTITLKYSYSVNKSNTWGKKYAFVNIGATRSFGVFNATNYMYVDNNYISNSCSIELGMIEESTYHSTSQFFDKNIDIKTITYDISKLRGKYYLYITMYEKNHLDSWQIFNIYDMKLE